MQQGLVCFSNQIKFCGNTSKQIEPSPLANFKKNAKQNIFKEKTSQAEAKQNKKTKNSKSNKKRNVHVLMQ